MSITTTAIMATAMFIASSSHCVLATEVQPALTAIPPPEAVSVEVVHAARIRSGPSKNIYPRNEVFDGREGWVVLSVMISPDGKPYEETVVDSSGNPAFEKAALKAVQEISFEPARRGATPIDSNLQFKLKFAIKDLEKGASASFVKAYRQFSKAVEARDRNGADEHFARMVPQNLYEEAFTNFGRYFYHLAWGTAMEQWWDLQQAIAGERQPVYLPKEAFLTALFAKFRIEVQGKEYGRALDTWDVLEPLASPEMRKPGQGVVDQIQAMIRQSDQALGLTGVISERRAWQRQLLRNQFRIVLKSGSIQEIKLRCAQKYLSFKFEPDIQYSIGAGKNRCGVEIVGEPGAIFDLIQ